MLKVGVVGCGTIAKVRHIPETIMNENTELAALYTATPGKAKKLAEEYHTVGYDTFEEFVQSDLDVAVICSPNAMHCEQTIACLNAGMHVLLEKPMAVTAEECKAMNEAAEKNGKLLMVAQNMRFAPVHQKAKECIEQGLIGDLLSFDMVYGHGGPEEWAQNRDPWFFHKDKSAMGALADIGIHKIDLIHYLLGEYIAEVSCFTNTMDKKYPDGKLIEVEDNAYMILRTESGICGTLHVGWTNYGTETNSTIIQGTKGVILCNADRTYDFIMECRGHETVQLNLGAEDSNEEMLAGKRFDSGVMTSFVNAILGKCENPIPGTVAAKAMDVVFAAMKSNETGNVERV